MSLERATVSDVATITKVPAMTKSEAIDLAREHGAIVLEGRAKIRKYWADDDPDRATPYEVVDTEPNLLLTAGANLMWTLLSGGSGTAYNAANARIAVGSGTTAASAGQTALVSQHTGGRQSVTGAPTIATNTITYQASFGTSVANGDWREIALVNAATDGTMFNRLVTDMGTKTNQATWIASLTLSAG